MQVPKISIWNYSQNFKGVSKLNKGVMSHLIDYNPNNITENEFREFVRYLANNKINKTFIEPVKFITETGRAQKEVFEDRIHYLAENNINLTFYC